MKRTRRHGFYYIGSLLFFVFVYTILYQYGMLFFEGAERTFFESLHVVVQSLTTTGYGNDAIWSSRPMLGLVILMQVTGVGYIFLTLPLFLVPWIEKRLAKRLPQRVDMTDHIVICGFSPIVEEIIEEFEEQGIEYVVLLEDADQVADLLDEGYTVVLGNPESTEVLENVSVKSSRAVIIDSSDERTASIALSIKDLTRSARVAALVADPKLTEYLELAGVDRPLLPRKLLGKGLAKEVSRVINTQLGNTVEIGADLQVIELPVFPDCAIEGKRLETAAIQEDTGATVIGAWLEGEFVPNPPPETVLDERTVLLVSGTATQLRAVFDLVLPPDGLAHKNTVVAGYGYTGKAVCRALESAQIQCSIIDEQEIDRVDVVGDATQVATLQQAGLDDAGALIIAVGRDTEAIFITLVARELNPDIEIVARVNDADNRSKLFAAGADYVLPLAKVAGRMIANAIMGEDVISYDTQIDIIRIAVPDFVGQTVGGAQIRKKTGCTILAIERGDETYTEIGPDFLVEPEDTLIVAGSHDAIDDLQRLSGALER